MKILLVDNYDSFTYNLYHLLEKVCEDTIIDVRRNNQIDLGSIALYNAVVLSPGPGIPSEAGQMPALIEHFKFTKPLLGVCLGHQAIAESFGYKLKNLPCVFHGVSTRMKIIDPDDPLYKHLPHDFTVGRYHSWTVESLDDRELVATAYSDDGEIMSFRHTSLPLFGVQYHPESVLSDYGEEIISNWFSTLQK